MRAHAALAGILAVAWTSAATAAPPAPLIGPLVRVFDMNLGESRKVQACDGTRSIVKVVRIKERTDNVRSAVRRVEVELEVDGKRCQLASGNYELPMTIGKIQIDCPVTSGYVKNAGSNYWGLKTDLRLRVWPAGSPWMRQRGPGTMVYPVRQRWFASATQMANEPCYVNACEDPQVRKIYYHYGLDFGGCEGETEVVSATNGMVVAIGKKSLPGYEDTPVRPRYDVVYVLDQRGWYYRYSHLASIDKKLRLGEHLTRGDEIGLLGKEGGSGGWSHLHFDIHCRMPSGEWGCQEGYAFVWEAYRRQFNPRVIAVARPHHVIWAGETVSLDAGKSFAQGEAIERYDWTFTDNSRAEGPRITRTYAKPGYYSEILKVTTSKGRVDYDFAIVHVLDLKNLYSVPPTIHMAYHPTERIRPGDQVTFKVRTFGTTDGREQWDFGDGSPVVETQSDGNVETLAKDGYAAVQHRFENPGRYIVQVHRTNADGKRAVCHASVMVGVP